MKLHIPALLLVMAVVTATDEDDTDVTGEIAHGHCERLHLEGIGLSPGDTITKATTVKDGETIRCRTEGGATGDADLFLVSVTETTVRACESNAMKLAHTTPSSFCFYVVGGSLWRRCL